MIKFVLKALCAGLTMAGSSQLAAQGSDVATLPTHKSAVRQASAERSAILGAAVAGKRIVTVGDRGVVLLSDDGGETFRQARSVPTRAALTSVHFVDDRFGWAAGHWGVVLHTEDGGETWKMQRDDRSTDQPLFSIWFADHQSGIAAGLFSLLLVTRDGGKSWAPATLPATASGKRADTNLFSIFHDLKGSTYVVGEQGLAYRTRDLGQTWELLQTGARGTLWTGLALSDGTLLVAGLRGSVYRSPDHGTSWEKVDVPTRSSITGLIQLANGDIRMAAMDGVTLLSADGGRTFSSQQRKDQAPLTAVVANSRGLPVFFSQDGLLREP